LIGAIFLIFLLGMTIVYVQQSRENAHLMQCSWHLHHLGVSSHVHVENSVPHQFPDGGGDPSEPRTWGKTEPAAAPRQNWGWAYQLLPHHRLLKPPKLGNRPGNSHTPGDPLVHDLEATATADSPYIQLWLNDNDQAVQTQPIKFYYCPSRRLPRLYEGLAKCDYAGNGGTDLKLGSDGVFVHNSSGIRHKPSAQLANRQEIASTLERGDSYTVTIGEKAYHPWLPGAHEGDSLAFTSGFGVDTIRWAGQLPCPDGPDISPQQFGSSHLGRLNFLYGDRSVRTMRFDIALEVFQELCVVPSRSAPK
jgi:hypothetical protein